MIRRWSDTVYAGYVDDGSRFGRFVGCGTLAEAMSYVEAAEAREIRDGGYTRTSRQGERIRESGERVTARRTRPNILTSPGSEAP